MNLEELPSETTPLVINRFLRRQARSPPSSHAQLESLRHQKDTAYRIIPFLFGTRFIAAITITPKIQVIREVACRLWLASLDPAGLPPGSRYPPQGALCKTASVEQIFSRAISALAVVDAFGAIVSSGIITRSAARYGRKPVMLILTLLITASTACFISAMSVRGILRDVLLLSWIIIGAFAGSMAFSLTCSMYVVDTTDRHERTFVLNVAEGFAVLGTAPSYWLGGYLSREYNITTVFWWKALATIPIVLYVTAFLPESFPPEKRAVVLQDEAPSTRPTTTGTSLLRRLLDIIESTLAPLKLLRPKQGTAPWRSKSRLLIIATSQFFHTLGSDYVGNAFVAYTGRFQIDPDHLAIALSGFAVSQTIWLSAVVPAILRWGRPFYNVHRRRRCPCPCHETEVQPGDSTPTVGRRFDVYFAFASSVLGALASTLIGLAPSSTALIAALIMFSLGTGYDPTARSVVVASANASKSDESLSALTIVSSMGALLAPLIFGSILSSTIHQFPELVFFLCAATIIFGGGLLLLAQDPIHNTVPPQMEEG